jgi:hypothetical protein
MHNAHFNLHSWASNSPSRREIAMKDGTADPKTIVNILSLKWNPSTDTLSFPPAQDYTPPPTITKRHVLQISSKIYDPLGLLSPVTVKAKLLMQELWQNELEWDEPLPLELKTKWLNIAKGLTRSNQRLHAKKIPFPNVLLHQFPQHTSMCLLMQAPRHMELWPTLPTRINHRPSWQNLGLHP